MTDRRRQMRRTRAREGAALVQALIVGLTMAITLACVIMFARAYSAKITAGQLARSAAWTDGTEGCPNGPVDSGGATQLADNPEQPGIVQQMTQAFFQLSPAQAAAMDTTADAPLLLGGETIGFQTVTQFSCNEEPRPEGDVASIGSAFVDLLSDIF
jgi:hypothetical protein